MQCCNLDHIFTIYRIICQPYIEQYLKGYLQKADVNIYCIEQLESCQIKIINTLTITLIIQDSIVFFFTGLDITWTGWHNSTTTLESSEQQTAFCETKLCERLNFVRELFVRINFVRYQTLCERPNFVRPNLVRDPSLSETQLFVRPNSQDLTKKTRASSNTELMTV